MATRHRLPMSSPDDASTSTKRASGSVKVCAPTTVETSVRDGMDEPPQPLLSWKAVSQALGMTLSHPGPMSKLGYERCKRFAMYVDDGTIKLIKVSELGPNGEEDPAGDDCAPPRVLIARPLRRPRPLAR